MSCDGWAALPRGAMGLSAVCDCGISWSYSLTIFAYFLSHLYEFYLSLIGLRCGTSKCILAFADSVVIDAPIVWLGGGGCVWSLLGYSVLHVLLLQLWAGCLALIVFMMPCDWCSMALPHGTMGWSALWLWYFLIVIIWFLEILDGLIFFNIFNVHTYLCHNFGSFSVATHNMLKFKKENPSIDVQLVLNLKSTKISVRN